MVERVACKKEHKMGNETTRLRKTHDQLSEDEAFLVSAYSAVIEEDSEENKIWERYLHACKKLLSRGGAESAEEDRIVGRDLLGDLSVLARVRVEKLVSRRGSEKAEEEQNINGFCWRA